MLSQTVPKIYPCPFLAKFSPAELVAKIAQIKGESSLYPVWLHNAGQHVVGFLPKMAWLVTPSQAQAQAQAGQILIEQLERQQICFTKNCYRQQNFLHSTTDSAVLDLQQRLIDYEASQLPTLAKISAEFHENYYQNGFIGFISYDLSAQRIANISPSDITSNIASNIASCLAYFGHYDCYLTWQQGQWQLHITSDIASPNEITYANNTYWHSDLIVSWLKTLADTQSPPTPAPLTLQPRWQYTDYQAAFETVQQYLYAGDCYQINLTQCWQGTLAQSDKLVAYLPALHAKTHAPFAGYVQLQNTVFKYELLSCSPELFLTFAKNKAGEITITAKPIKGTRPRSDHPAHDELLKTALANSDKDKAENVMIVDLLRNDLGKYAKTGSVGVSSLFAIESFSNVHHMVSTVTATLRKDIHPLTLLFDSVPAGSITGTPKKRAVEIIDAIEQGKRGAYCGTLGFLNFATANTATGQWNVLIRTLQAVSPMTTADHQVTLWAGGGITVGSTCEAEYQECFDKVGNLLAVLQQKRQQKSC